MAQDSLCLLEVNVNVSTDRHIASIYSQELRTSRGRAAFSTGCLTAGNTCLAGSGVCDGFCAFQFADVLGQFPPAFQKLLPWPPLKIMEHLTVHRADLLSVDVTLRCLGQWLASRRRPGRRSLVLQLVRTPTNSERLRVLIENVRTVIVGDFTTNLVEVRLLNTIFFLPFLSFSK